MLNVTLSTKLGNKYRSLIVLSMDKEEEIRKIYKNLIEEIMENLPTTDDRMTMNISLGGKRTLVVQHRGSTTILEVPITGTYISYQVSILVLPTSITLRRSGGFYPTHIIDNFDIDTIIDTMFTVFK